MRFLPLFLLLACGGDVTTVDRVTLALEGAGSALELGSSLTDGNTCVGLKAGGVALRGTAVGVRTHSLPALELDISSCGVVDSVRLDCELKSWLEAGTSYGASITSGVLDGLSGQVVSIPAVTISKCE